MTRAKSPDEYEWTYLPESGIGIAKATGCPVSSVVGRLLDSEGGTCGKSSS